MAREICPICGLDEDLEERESDGVREVVCVAHDPPQLVRRVDTGSGASVEASRPTARSVRRSTSIAQEHWDDYDRWNTAIRDTVFDGRHAGRPVYLDLEGDVLEEVAQRAEAPLPEAEERFCEAVGRTLSLPDQDGKLLRPHLGRLDAWERAFQGSSEPPDEAPFLGVLGLFVVAAERMRPTADFAAHNYYARLCEVLGVDAHEHKGLIGNHYRAHALRFWDALNLWLEAWEGERGLPTARAEGHWRYIAPALTQALIKQADRQHLPSFFDEHGLSPGQNIPAADLQPLLASWVPNSSLSSPVKSVWEHSTESQRQVAEIVADALASWTGEAAESRARTDTGGELLLIASLRTVMGRRLELSAAVRSGRDEFELELTGDATEPARAAVPEPVPMRRRMEGWATLVDPTRVSFPDLLNTPIELRNEEGQTFVRHPRRVTVLQFDTERQHHVERARAQLGEDGLLLVHRSLVEEVGELLQAVARPGFERHDELPGLPNRWVLFDKVQLLDVPDVERPDLQPLVPASAAQLMLRSGLAISGRTRRWHVQRPPEVIATDAGPDAFEIVVTCRRIIGKGPEDRPAAITIGPFEGAAAVALDDHELEEGDYELTLVHHGADREAPFARSSLRLRSADTPLPSLVKPTDHLVRDLAIPWSVVSAVSIEERGEEPEVRAAGADVTAPEPPDDVGAVQLEPTLEIEGEPPEGEFDVVSPRIRQEALVAELPDCLETGAHYWELPTYYGTTRGDEVAGRCRDCGLRRSWPARPRRRGSRGDAGRRDAGGSSGRRRTVTEVPPIAASFEVDWNLLLDAMSYLEAGAWSEFDRLARQLQDDPLFVHQAGQTLVALGHIEVTRSRRDLTPDRWSITPPTIALIGREPARAVLVGWRSDGLVGAVAGVATAAGGELETRRHEAAPDTVSITGLTAHELRDVAAAVSERIGRDVGVADRPAQRLVAAVPALGDLLDELPRRPVVTATSIERFDPWSVSWEPAEHMMEEGAFRLRGYTTLYVLRTATDLERAEMHVGDAQLVKHLAAASVGRDLLAYDPSEAVLQAPLGAEPPGLLERAAVLSSGEPPTQHRNGVVSYTSVPPPVAAGIHRLLTATATGRRA